MIRAAWHKRRLKLLEADLYPHRPLRIARRHLVDVLLSDSPAAKLLARVQRQIAAFERTWFRANTELLRLRAAGQQAEPPAAELASFPHNTSNPPRTPAAWPPIDANTGRPAYFVG